jgi:hypothetical protein
MYYAQADDERKRCACEDGQVSAETETAAPRGDETRWLTPDIGGIGVVVRTVREEGDRGAMVSTPALPRRMAT